MMASVVDRPSYSFINWIYHSFNSLCAVLCALTLFAASAQAQTATEGPMPTQVISDSYQSLQRLIDDKVLVAGMPEPELLALMEKELGPVVDFARISRKVMGKFARRASDEQREQFNAVFKESLVKTYSKGLENLDQLKATEVGEAVFDQKKKRAKVPSVIILKDGQRFQVQYSMFKNKQSQWKVENIIVEGVNIGLVFRNQFAHYMEQYNDVGQVIENWGIVSAE